MDLGELLMAALEAEGIYPPRRPDSGEVRFPLNTH